MKKPKSPTPAIAASSAVAPGTTGTAPKKVTETMSTKIDSELVRQLADVLNETGLTEVEYESGGLRIRVARNVQHTVMSAAPAAMAYAPAAAATAPAAPATPADAANHPGAVKSPMVGVAYLSPEPGAAPFITVGASISEGQTIALIEAMKTFNPVKAPRSGKIVRIMVENGAPVEYGEVLVVIE